MEVDWTPLSDLKPGEKGIIRGFREDNSDEDYLMELGLMIGTVVTLVKFAPFGDPLEIKARGFFLSIRKSEAKFILIERIKDR